MAEKVEVVITIPKYYLEHPQDYSCLAECVRRGTPIPDNATNGDIVQMMFPYYSYERNDYVQSTEDYIVDSMECMEHDLYFAYDWWNAPYQKGGKE